MSGNVSKPQSSTKNHSKILRIWLPSLLNQMILKKRGSNVKWHQEEYLWKLKMLFCKKLSSTSR